MNESSNAATVIDPEGLTAHQHVEEVKKSSSCNLTPFILMIALSVHSCFEGLAAGLQMNLTNLLNIIFAITIHKSAASVSLGIALVKTFPNDFRLVRQLIFVFALATPLGVVLGMIFANAGEIYSIVFSSLAAGTFIYIACTEVIVEQFSTPGNRWLKLFVFLIGCTIITCLWFIPGS